MNHFHQHMGEIMNVYNLETQTHRQSIVTGNGCIRVISRFQAHVQPIAISHFKMFVSKDNCF